MLTNSMKWLSVAAILFLLLLLPRISYAGYPTMVAALTVWAGAVVVMVQAARSGRYVWMSLFLLVAVIFNPALPVMLSRSAFLVLDLGTLAMFGLSLVLLQSAPRLSIASITDRTPGSLSL